MALTADLNYETVGPTEILAIEAGAADTLYKGGIMNIGTDGYIKVAADVASEIPAGVMKKNHVADGSAHEQVEVETGKIWLAHSGAAQTDVGAFFFATADSYEMLMASRFALGFVGAGFVIGIRMISEWFPAKQVGIAEGIYGGWGNFGSAAAALSLPTLALMYGGDDGWRYAIATTGVITLVYSFIFYNFGNF